MNNLQIKLTPKQKKETEPLVTEMTERAERGDLCGVLAQLNLERGVVECVILDAETSKAISVLVRNARLAEEARMELEQADGAARKESVTREMEW